MTIRDTEYTPRFGHLGKTYFEVPMGQFVEVGRKLMRSASLRRVRSFFAQNAGDPQRPPALLASSWCNLSLARRSLVRRGPERIALLLESDARHAMLSFMPRS